MFQKSDSFSYEINPNFDYVIDEKGNAFIALREIKWNNSEDYKLDLRKYYNTKGEEQMNKGVSFLTEEGPHELAKILVENNYGYTLDILTAIKNRTDFKPSLNKALGKDDENYDSTVKDDDNYYDPKESLL